jgi:putative flavoprotein involved in K+ transport
LRAAATPPSAAVDTLVVGAGQAGLSLSRYLTRAGHEHVLLDRGRVGQRWRERWETLSLLSPNWLNRLPGGDPHADPDGFLDRARFVTYLEGYAGSFGAPVHEGVAVHRVERRGPGFRVVTNEGEWHARQVVVATGACDVPYVPLAAPSGVVALHTAGFRRPEQLPGGPVLVVGAGASGQQLALDLRRAGRDVVLAAGRHSRAHRRYRGRDIFEWLRILGDLDRTVDEMPDPDAARRVPSFPLSGANGGEEIGLDVLAAHGVTVAGRLAGFDGTRAVFADSLPQDVAKATSRLEKLRARIDAHELAAGAEPEPLRPVLLGRGPRSLETSTLGAVVWATGYRRAYPWLRVPGALAADGELPHGRGVTRVPGLYVLGLEYHYRRSSHFIGGVGRDAAALATLVTRPVSIGARRRLLARAA